MSLSSTCIKRPVLATVLNLVLVILGAIGLMYLGVRDYPSVDPPIISVSTSFTGANAEVIETQITEPLEAAINGVQGIRSLSSTSRDGMSRIRVEFELGVDLETVVVYPWPENKFKVVVDIYTQLLFFDFAEKKVVRTVPINYQYITLLKHKPSRKELKDIILNLKSFYICQNWFVGIQLKFLNNFKKTLKYF